MKAEDLLAAIRPTVSGPTAGLAGLPFRTAVAKGNVAAGVVAEAAFAAERFGIAGPSQEAAKEAGATKKTWHLGSGDNHRASHLSLNGVTVGIDERFPNGLRYPHAPGPPAETVNCNCFATFGR